MSENEKIRIHEERDKKLKVIEYKVEEIMETSPERRKQNEQEVPIEGGRMVEAFSVDSFDSESEDLDL